MKKTLNFISVNYRLILQISLALFFIASGIYFMLHEQAEIGHVTNAIISAKPMWLIIGSAMVIIYVLVMAWMYTFSFRAISKKISLNTAVILFLKRNLVSVFLPAGVLTNLAFFNNEVEKKEDVSRTEIYFASSIYTFCSIASTIILGIPVLIWLAFKHMATSQHVVGISLTLIILLVGFISIRSFLSKKEIYHFFQKRFPGLTQKISEFSELAVNRTDVLMVLGLSVVIEIIGIIHLYISLTALGLHSSLEMAVLGYSVVLLILMSSPFLRGIGAIEVALVFVLKQYGISDADAITTTFLFRFFEFWSLLILGVLAFLLKKDSLLFRILPAALLFFLGMVNILSVLSPALHSRLAELNNFLPLNAIEASNYLVLFSGFFMFIVSAYLIKGLYRAWIIALILSSVSLLGHILKGIDLEEACIALVTLIVLIYERKHYYLKTDQNHLRKIWPPALMAVISIIIFGTLAFFFLDQKHFDVNFSLKQSFIASLESFFLINSPLKPHTLFGHRILQSMNWLGIISLSYLSYAILKPLFINAEANEDAERNKAVDFIREYGRSNLDYFKTYYDKKYWISENSDAVVAFKNTRNYAMALENPVITNHGSFCSAVAGFESFCKSQGLRTAYYRVPETDIHLYQSLGKKTLPIGEEAFIKLNEFSTGGRKMKAFRNAVSKVTSLNLHFRVNQGTHKGDFLQKLRAVSDSWLADMGRHEIGFSQGIFNEDELKNQTILTVENDENRIIAFINLIPSTIPDTANFDLIRKEADAPGGTIDFLYIKMFEYFKEQGFNRCTLGMVPFSGIGQPTNLNERIIKLAYEKIARFSSYRNLRFYKDKFDPEWQMQYLVYETPLDLFFIPSALEKVIKI